MKVAVETVTEVRKKVRSFDIRVEVENKLERNGSERKKDKKRK